ncbi:MAG TPA: TatD family hydrolase [Roseiflexaceae bacterium]|nr:TatD family hydrolase [Roseiflexaceae bacterium]
MLIDAHAHLDQYDADRAGQALAELARHRVLTLSVAMDPPSYARACALAERSPWVIPSFGIHPWRAPEYAGRLDVLAPLIDASPLLGEIGLDFHWVEDRAAFPAQRAVFEHFLALARAQGKIVNLHTKGAEAEVLDALARQRVERAIVHWYSGPLDVADALAARGALFTVGVELHFSPLIQELARRLPAELLLTETDNPGGQEWLTGDVGMPAHLPGVLAALARLRHTPVEELRACVAANFRRLIEGDAALLRFWRRLCGPPVVAACRDDIPAWLALAAEVEPLFGPMVGEPAFHSALERNIDRGTAFCVRTDDGPPGAPLLGGLLFSASHAPEYRIGWLAVSAAARRQGIGRALAERALALTPLGAELSVVTFGADQPGAEPARAFYQRLGFAPAELARHARQVFRLAVPPLEDC